MKIVLEEGTVDIDINKIIDDLPEDQRISIMENAAQLINHIKTEHPLVPFSMVSALEVICKIGMYQAKHPNERVI